MILHGDATQRILIFLRRPLSHQTDLTLALNGGQRIIQLMRGVTDKRLLALVGPIYALHHLSGITTADPTHTSHTAYQSDAE